MATLAQDIRSLVMQRAPVWSRPRKVIYLAGPTAWCTPEEMSEWRDAVKDALSPIYDFLDPTRRLYDEHTPAGTVISSDVEDIWNSDIVLANSWQPSYGTTMEIPYGHLLGKTVITVLPSLEFVSHWVRYHSTHVFGDLSDAVEFLGTGS